MVDKFPLEISRVVLHSIQSHPIQRQLCPNPFAPSENILSDFRVGVVHISEHQKVVVAVLVADIWRPSFVGSDDLVDGALLPRIVPVDAAKMVPVVFHRAVLVAAAGEVVAHPALDFLWLRDIIISFCDDVSQRNFSII